MQVRLSARSANDDELVADLARVAADNGSGVLTRARYDRYGAFHSSTIVRRLGGWATACSKAGLTTGRSDLGHADEVWMSNIYEVWIATGRQPSYDAMRIGTSRFSPEGYARRYGSWTQALVSFQHWIDGANTPGRLTTLRKRM